MRYSRDGKWTPVPFPERVKLAGKGLLVPPIMMAFCYVLLGGVLWGVFSVFPRLRGHSQSWSDHPIWTFWFLASQLWLLIVYELALINTNEFATLEEMLSERLATLEEEMARVRKIHPVDLWAE